MAAITQVASQVGWSAGNFTVVGASFQGPRAHLNGPRTLRKSILSVAHACALVGKASWTEVFRSPRSLSRCLEIGLTAFNNLSIEGGSLVLAGDFGDLDGSDKS